MPTVPTVLLTGQPGVGKTTVGAEISACLHDPPVPHAFVDLDQRLSDAEARQRDGIAENGDGAVYPSVAWGQILANHPKAMHGGGPNRSLRDRSLLVVQFGRRGDALRHRANGETLTLCGRGDFLGAARQRQGAIDEVGVVTRTSMSCGISRSDGMERAVS